MQPTSCATPHAKDALLGPTAATRVVGHPEIVGDMSGKVETRLNLLFLSPGKQPRARSLGYKLFSKGYMYPFFYIPALAITFRGIVWRYRAIRCDTA